MSSNTDSLEVEACSQILSSLTSVSVNSLLTSSNEKIACCKSFSEFNV